MKRDSKIHNTIYLISLGILGALILIIGWLRGQYIKEYDNLQRQLKGSLFESTIEIRDSLLHEMILSQKTDTVQVTVFSDTLGRLPKPPRISDQEMLRTKEYVFNLDNSIEDGNFTKVSTIQVGDTSDLIMESLLLFVDELNFGDSVKVTFPSSINAYKDLQKMLQSKLGEIYPNLKFEAIPEINATDAEYELIFESPFLRKKAFLVVHNDVAVILNALKWEFVLALIAFLIITAALFITYLQLRKLIAINNIRDAFVANVSHEISTPLSTIKVALESISKHQAANDVKLSQEYIHIAETELQRLSNLTDSIIQVKNLTDPSFQLDKISFSLSQQIAIAVKISSVKIETKDIQIAYSTSKEYEIFGDENLLMGVWINLIENAIKYSQRGTISISIQEQNQDTIVVVEDQGEGIPMEYSTKIFEQFFRVPTGNIHNVKGNGIGLYYCKQIIEKHDGSIQYTPGKLEGSIFTVTIPTYNEK
jgi:signal transduction histidine kinase